jgi:ABC-type branched-subunit amino acid transport system ATPase component
MALLEVDRVEKDFPGVKALNGVSIKVEKNEIHGLIGPNGSGKSTMIYTILGIYHCDGGSIRFDGVDLGKSRIWERVHKGINATNQTATYVGDLPVRRHLELGIMINGFPKTDVERIADLVDLSDQLDQMPGTLSALGAKKLEFGKAMSTRPSFLMLDECFAGLSFEEGEEMVSIIQKAVADHDMTILLVDHNLGLVEKVAHQTTVIDRGNLIAQGTFEEIVNDPVVIEAYMG